MGEGTNLILIRIK